MFTWRELEVLVTGRAEIDVALLRVRKTDDCANAVNSRLLCFAQSKTEYRGRVAANDRHIAMFWETLESFSQEDRKLFLQFVWGRSEIFALEWQLVNGRLYRTRLPPTSVGFGQHLFKVSDHAQVRIATVSVAVATVSVHHALPCACRL